MQSNGPTALRDLGISKQQSSDWQRLAAVPQKNFEAALADKSKMPSTAAIIRENTPRRPPHQQKSPATVCDVAKTEDVAYHRGQGSRTRLAPQRGRRQRSRRIRINHDAAPSSLFSVRAIAPGRCWRAARLESTPSAQPRPDAGRSSLDRRTTVKVALLSKHRRDV